MMHIMFTVTYYFVLGTPETVSIHEIWAAIQFPLIQDPMEVQTYIQGTTTVPLKPTFEKTGLEVGGDMQARPCWSTTYCQSSYRMKFMDLLELPVKHKVDFVF